jgi:class 3 adenylate cyclase
LAVLAGNELIHQWLTGDYPIPTGVAVTELFPELIGAEEQLRSLFHNGEMFTLRQVYRAMHPVGETAAAYFDLQIERAKSMDGLLLLTILDVSIQTYHQQRIQQQRNENQLLAAQVTRANDQLAFLLKRFVPEPVATELIASHRTPELGSEMEREATVLFADMRGFTGLAEELAPQLVLNLLNEYLGIVAQSVLRHEGTLVQVVGDMVMGVFNLPGLQPDHARRAVEASLDIQQSLQAYLQQKGASGTGAPVGFGIGISTGNVVAGYLGLQQRYRYAVVGDTTNVAFYLCSQAAAGQIILCESTIHALTHGGLPGGRANLPPGMTLIPLGEVWPKRRRQAVRTYALAAARS